MLYHKKIIKWGIVGILLLIFAIIYQKFNPLEHHFFPKCPFFVTTGLQCPGCGSQRAVHHLLNLNIIGAIKQNAILVLSIPYLLVGFIFNLQKNYKNKKLLQWRNRLFGLQASYIILFIIITFWILRNIL